MRIAVIGGSFDPIHCGHIQMARHLLRNHLVSEVWFMPTKETPLKNRQLTSYDIRVSLIQKAIAYDANMRVCTLEGERLGPSYTVDTIRELKRRYPMHSFVWVIGNDQARQLSAWKQIDELSKEITFYVFPREQEEVVCAYPHQAMRMALMDVSSSHIRRGEKLWLLPKAIRHAVIQEPSYLRHMVSEQMSERRYRHSEGVADLCVELALVHHVDVNQAFQAGLLHDICKEWGKDRLGQYLSHLDSQKLQEPAPIWHGYAGAYYVSKAMYFHDPEVRSAIYHHVRGSTHSKLAMILYVADKLDRSRGYDSSAEIQLCRENLMLGYQKVQKQQAMYINKEKGTNHESNIGSNRSGD